MKSRPIRRPSLVESVGSREIGTNFSGLLDAALSLLSIDNGGAGRVRISLRATAGIALNEHTARDTTCPPWQRSTRFGCGPFQQRARHEGFHARVVLGAHAKAGALFEHFVRHAQLTPAAAEAFRSAVSGPANPLRCCNEVRARTRS